jgi:bifunctional non-homologous end joining protein LigD
MQIRRNTKAFKTILEIVTSCRDRADRQDLIRLYITRAGQQIADRIAIEGNKSEAAFFYDLGYQAILNNLGSSNHQLYQSDEVPGIYYFHSTISKDWDEAPFEFDTKIKEEYSSLPELPTTREKGKEKEFVLPTQTSKTEIGKAKPSKKEKASEKESPAPGKATMFINRGPKQPDYKLKHEIEFSDLDRLAFRNPQVTKKDVLDYYEKMSEYILPYLKDREHDVRPKKEIRESPSWIKSSINDKENLLFYVEHGAVEFDVSPSKKDNPDFTIVVIDSGSEFVKAIDVANHAKMIFDGLKIPSFIKTDGVSGLHVHIPLDGESDFEASKNFAEYLCKLMKLKIPDLVTLNGAEDYSYGKVTLDYSLNEEGRTVVAPYSIVANTAALVATPLSWDEISEGLKPEDFNYETVVARLKKEGDVMEGFMKKKVNAGEMVERMEESYGFLF